MRKKNFKRLKKFIKKILKYKIIRANIKIKNEKRYINQKKGIIYIFL